MCVLSRASAPPFMFLIFQESLHSPGGRETVASPNAVRAEAECSCLSAARSHPLPLFKPSWKRCPESKGK